ncbi:hypothetical protein GYMLUDRAFT_145163, partial [Collybiopsis luxurians FD-317 M1]
IDTEIYMKQPEGFRHGGPEKVCRLNKSLYGLKQLLHLWSKELAMIVPVWADDITLASKDAGAIDHFVEEL